MSEQERIEKIVADLKEIRENGWKGFAGDPMDVIQLAIDYLHDLTTARAQLAVLAAEVTAAWEYIDGYETTGHDYAETHGTKLRYAACQRAHEKTLSDPALAALVEGGGR